MINKNDNPDLVIWDDKYATGIELIDNQHKELVSLTNELFHACIDDNGHESIGEVFKETMRRMVEYVHFHFGAEQEMLQRIKYPEYQEHKKQHDAFVRSVLESVKAYNEGKALVPNHFVRSLRDWILSHIALSDKLYASYITAQKKKGLLNDKVING
jgi:hemerythrin